MKNNICSECLLKAGADNTLLITDNVYMEDNVSLCKICNGVDTAKYRVSDTAIATIQNNVVIENTYNTSFMKPEETISDQRPYRIYWHNKFLRSYDDIPTFIQNIRWYKSFLLKDKITMFVNDIPCILTDKNIITEVSLTNN